LGLSFSSKALIGLGLGLANLGLLVEQGWANAIYQQRSVSFSR